MNKRVVVDNFLTPEQHRNISRVFFNGEFPWYYSDGVSGLKESSPFAHYFSHVVYGDFRVQSRFFDIFHPVLEVIKPKSLVRIKANFYPNTHKIIKHEYHTDQPFDVKSLLYFVNDNDGITTFQDTGEEIQSVANRGLFFNSHDPHCSSTTTNSNCRITINFNYF